MSNLPCVILAGGKGTRLSEETTVIPKPMLYVGDRPLLQHIIDIYIKQGVFDFYVPAGYKMDMILGHFLNNPYMLSVYTSHLDRVFEFQMTHYRVTVVDTGMETQTGGRLHRLREFLKGPFHFTYGDGLGNVDVRTVQWWFEHHKEAASMTLVRPEGRFGRAVENRQGKIIRFGEKVESENDWINGGFTVMSPLVLDGIADTECPDKCNLEKEIYPVLARHGYMGAVHHTGFWKCVDTLRDLEDLRTIYEEKGAEWLKLL